MLKFETIMISYYCVNLIYILLAFDYLRYEETSYFFNISTLFLYCL